LYASRASQGTGQLACEEILSQSRRNNPRYGITGLLLFSGGIFVQVIEGGRKNVSQLLTRIARDERNSDLQILLFAEIGERMFESWTMGQVALSSLNPALLLKHSERAELDPFSLGASATMALLTEIAASGAVQHRAD
jgi:hypothetical protein